VQSSFSSGVSSGENDEEDSMKTYESSAVTVARAVLGILASVALTAGAAMGVAAELQRGFFPVFEAAAERQVAARAPSRESRPAPAQPGSRTAALPTSSVPNGG
jgi:hypothetical protein